MDRTRRQIQSAADAGDTNWPAELMASTQQPLPTPFHARQSRGTQTPTPQQSEPAHGLVVRMDPEGDVQGKSTPRDHAPARNATSKGKRRMSRTAANGGVSGIAVTRVTRSSSAPAALRTSSERKASDEALNEAFHEGLGECLDDVLDENDALADETAQLTGEVSTLEMAVALCQKATGSEYGFHQPVQPPEEEDPLRGR